MKRASTLCAVQRAVSLPTTSDIQQTISRPSFPRTLAFALLPFGLLAMAGSSAQLARARARDQLGTIPVITHQHESLPTAPSLLSDIETKLPTLSPAGHEHLPLPASMPDTSLFPRHEDRSQTQKKQRKGRKTEKRSSKTLDEGPRKVPSRSTVPETPVEEPDPTNDDWMYEMSFPATGEDWSEDNRVDPPPHEGQNEMQQDADLYARMIFHEKVAYVARIDERTWALEGVKGGITQVSTSTPGSSVHWWTQAHLIRTLLLSLGDRLVNSIMSHCTRVSMSHPKRSTAHLATVVTAKWDCPARTREWSWITFTLFKASSSCPHDVSDGQ